MAVIRVEAIPVVAIQGVGIPAGATREEDIRVVEAGIPVAAVEVSPVAGAVVAAVATATPMESR